MSQIFLCPSRSSLFPTLRSSSFALPPSPTHARSSLYLSLSLLFVYRYTRAHATVIACASARAHVRVYLVLPVCASISAFVPTGRCQFLSDYRLVRNARSRCTSFRRCVVSSSSFRVADLVSILIVDFSPIYRVRFNAESSVGRRRRRRRRRPSCVCITCTCMCVCARARIRSRVSLTPRN